MSRFPHTGIQPSEIERFRQAMLDLDYPTKAVESLTDDDIEAMYAQLLGWARIVLDIHDAARR